jgi:phage tail sheath gpL-like
MQGGGCLIITFQRRIAHKRSLNTQGKHAMGINSESDISANLQIGPTTEGMVRIYVAGEGVDLPLDFDPEEAEEIAEELRGAAQAARKMAEGAKGKKR